MAGESRGDRQVNIYACASVTLATASLALGGRLFARRLTRAGLWFDDYFAIVGFVFAVAWTTAVYYWLQFGLGLYLDQVNLPLDQLYPKYELILFVTEIFYGLSLGFSKYAILALYWRMFAKSNIRIPIQILIGCTSIWLIIRTFMTIFHCIPVDKFWNIQKPGFCHINDFHFMFATVLVHLVIDICILVLPVYQVHKLQLPMIQRIGITAMFMFGIFVCAASVAVLMRSAPGAQTNKADNISWEIAPFVTWATAEVNLAVVSACLPMLRPIYLVITKRGQSYAGSSNLTYASTAYGNHSRLRSEHQLSTFNKIKGPEADSIRELAAPTTQRRGTSDSDSDFSTHSDNKEQTTTVVAQKATSDSTTTDTRRVLSQRERSNWRGSGIMVTNETTIKVSEA